jgi:WD40 repeat protein
MAWSHDTRTLAIGTSAGTLGLYDAATLSLRTTVGRVSSGFIDTASFAPDDQTLVTADSAGSLVFWSVPTLTREGQRVVLANSASIGGLGGVFAWYSPSGDVVGLAADDRRPDAGVRFFDFQARPAALAKLACDLAGGDMSRADWHQYLGDRSYRHVCPGA